MLTRGKGRARWMLPTALFLVLALLVTACGGQQAGSQGGEQQGSAPAEQGGGTEQGPEASAEPIKIGVPLPLTGSKANFGEIKRNSYLMAQEKINTEGGVNGRPLEFVIRDDGGEAEKAAAVAEEFITVDKLPMIVGAYSSAETYAVAGVAQRYGVPYLADTGAADKVTQQGWDYVFRLNPSSSFYNQGLNAFLAEVVKPESIAIIYEQTDFGSSTADATEKESQAAGIEVVLKEAYDAGALDFKSLLSKVKSKNPDVVYMVSYVMDASQLMKNAKELKLEPKVFAGAAAGFALPEFIENAGAASEYVVTGTLWSPQVKYPGAVEYAEDYKSRFGDYPSYHGAEAYSTAFVVKDVLERAGSLEPDALRDALVETDMMTVFGPVKFESFENYTNQNRLDTLVLQVIDGEHQTIWPKDAASADYVYPIPGWDER